MNQEPESRNWYKWLEAIDIFGIPIRFHINKQFAFKTAFSGTLSLFIIFVLLFSGVSMIVDAIFQSKAHFLSSSALDTTSVLNLNYSNFIVALEVNGTSFSPQKSFYSFEFQHISLDESGNTKTESFGAVRCTEEYLSLHNNEPIKSNVNNTLCPEKWIYPISPNNNNYIKISIKKCESAVNSPIECASNEEIEKYFNSNDQSPLVVSLYMTDYVLNLLDQKQQKHLKKFEFIVSGGAIAKRTDIYIREEQVEFEDNILNTLKKRLNINNAFKVEDRIMDQIFFSSNSPSLEINIKKSELTQKYFVTSTNLSQVLSFLGGLSKALVVIASIIAIPYNEFNYNLAVSNEIYEFDTRPKEFYKTQNRRDFQRNAKRTFSQIDTSIWRLRPVSGAQQVKDSPRSSSNRMNLWQIRSEKVKHYFSYFESLLLQHQRLTYSTKEVIKRLFCCKGRRLKIKDNLYAQAKQRLGEDIDIITLLRKLKDIDKLKCLMLSQDQLTLFNYKKPLEIRYLGSLQSLQTPVTLQGNRRGAVEAEMKKKSLYLPERHLETYEQFTSLFQAYKTLIKDTSNQLNEQLVEMLGTKILKIFEKLERDYQKEVNALEEPPCSVQESKDSFYAPNLQRPKEEPLVDANLSKKSSESPIYTKRRFSQGFKRKDQRTSSYRKVSSLTSFDGSETNISPDLAFYKVHDSRLNVIKEAPQDPEEKHEEDDDVVLSLDHVFTPFRVPAQER